MKLIGANPAAKARGMERLPGEDNYFVGNDPARWRSHVPTYAKVSYKQVYPGIDLVYYGNPTQLEYDFVLAPGADPGAIRLQMASADKLALDAHGDLLIDASGQELKLATPVAYQEGAKGRRRIPAAYVIQSGHQIGFQVAAYDSTKPLTIDPVVIYSSYLGGGADENAPPGPAGLSGAAVAVDADGNAYLTGYTTSVDFPLVNAEQSTPLGSSDIFITKIDSSGSTILYSTFLGGGGDEDGLGIAVDSSGNAYVTGFTTSLDFPTTPGAFRTAPYSGSMDVFVTKLNSSGSTVDYSTYLGGNGANVAYGIAVDSSGSVYVGGSTSSTNFPSNGYQRSQHSQYLSYGYGNAFVTKFNANGSLAYSTYLGGSVGDSVAGIAVDGAGNAYVTGSTISPDFPTTSGALDRHCGTDGNCNSVPYYDGFITKLNANGSGLSYSTFLGGSANDFATGIAVDSSGNAYVAGYTYSSDFPTTSGARQTSFSASSGNPVAFVTKLNAGGSSPPVYSTYLGGSGGDEALGIALDSSDNAYVAGATNSADFPLEGQPFQSSNNGQTDAFVAKLDASGSKLSYASYLGGSQSDFALALAVDGQGNAYVTGVTASTDFPTLNPVQGNLSGASDAFIVKVRDSASGGPTLAPNSVVNGASFASSAAVSPGSIATVFGSALASANSGGTTLKVNGIQASVLGVVAGQINFQVPWELSGSQANLVATTNGIPSNQITMNLTQFAPGIFQLSRTDGATNQGAVLISNSNVVVAPSGTVPGRNSRPANPGDYITIYCTGLGPVSNQPPTGTPASANPLSWTNSIPVVIFGTVAAAPTFYGLSPGFLGLYQIDVQVPQNAPTGLITLAVQAGGITSNTVTIAVQ